MDSGSRSLALVLNVVAGWTDGVGATWISGVFVSFMSGNTTSTGVALGTGDWRGLLHVGVAIPLFVLGAAAGALLMNRPSGRIGALLAVAVLLVVFQAWAAAQGRPDPDAVGVHELVPLALLVLPMGVLNTTVRRVGAVSISVGFVTGTLTSLGEALAGLLRERSRQAATRTVLLAVSWAAFLVGAVGGAAAVVLIPGLSVAVPVLVLLAVVVLESVRVRRRRAVQPSSTSTT